MVHHISSSKNPGYTGGCGIAIRPAVNADIAICHVQLAFKNFGVWSVSDGNEDSMYGEGRRFTAEFVQRLDSSDPGVVTEHFL